LHSRPFRWAKHTLTLTRLRSCLTKWWTRIASPPKNNLRSCFRLVESHKMKSMSHLNYLLELWHFFWKKMLTKFQLLVNRTAL
jgi:hypothetical protein